MPSEPSSQPLAEQPPDPTSLSILLVDDEQRIREALSEYLVEISNHRVITAGNGEEALKLAKSQRFDAAFLDLKMPGMSGVELLGRLKAIDQTLPVVIMTGFPSLDAAVDTMRQGASDFLIKPFNLKQVSLTLERVVREQRLLAENLRLSERLRHQEKIERLNVELERRIREQNIIRRMSEAIDHMHTSEEIYQGMADLARHNLEADKAAVFLLDRANHQLLVIAVSGLEQNLVGTAAGLLGSGVLGKVASEGQPILGSRSDGNGSPRIIKPDHNYLVLPIKIREEIFGVMLVADKKGGAPFAGQDLFLARFLLDKAALSIENIALYESMVANLHSTLGTLVAAMEAKDPYTRRHSRRVTNFSVLTAQTMGLGLDDIETLRFAAYLHDIGKIGVKDHILLKETTLSEEEFVEIKKHPVIGEQIIGDLDLSPNERSIIRHHHERWDGAGYPDGMTGAEIPLLARIVAVADAFDAMNSDRPYRSAKTHNEAVNELLSCSFQQFDGDVVKAFLEMLSRYHPAAGKD